jgi:hypothetical protein
MMRAALWQLARTRQKPERVHHKAADQASSGLLFIIFFAVWRPEMMSEEKPSSFRLGARDLPLQKCAVNKPRGGGESTTFSSRYRAEKICEAKAEVVLQCLGRGQNEVLRPRGRCWESRRSTARRMMWIVNTYVFELTVVTQYACYTHHSSFQQISQPPNGILESE